MALQKEITFDTGAVATYHKISNVNIIYNNSISAEPSQNTGSFYVNINVASYKDSAWRTEKPYISVRNHFCNITVNSGSIESVNRAFLYEKLKENNTYSGSLDV